MSKKDKIVGVEIRNGKDHFKDKTLSVHHDDIQCFYEGLICHHQELFILNTCNRFAIYAYTNNLNQLIDFFSKELSISLDGLHIFESTIASTKHFFETCAGLHSPILGEYEILGQVRSAKEHAAEHGFIGVYLSLLITSALHTGKKIRKETSIAASNLSYSSICQKIISTRDHQGTIDVLIFGTGKLAQSIIKLLSDSCYVITVVSHSLERSIAFSQEHSIYTILMQDAFENFAQYDVVIGVTQHELDFFVNDAKCPRTGLQSKRSQTIIDLGSPQNFPASVQQSAGVYYNLEGISSISDKNHTHRKKAVLEASQIIECEVALFLQKKSDLHHQGVYKQYWNQLNIAKDQQLEWLFPKVGTLDSKQMELIELFAHRLLRSVSRDVFRSARQAENKEEIIETLKSIYNEK